MERPLGVDAAPSPPPAPPGVGAPRPRGRLRALVFGTSWRGFLLRGFLGAIAFTAAGVVGLSLAIPLLLRWAGAQAALDLKSARSSVALLDGVLVLEEVEGKSTTREGEDPEVQFEIERLEIRAEPFAIARDRRIASVTAVRPRVTVRGAARLEGGADSPLMARLERALADTDRIGPGEARSAGYALDRIEVTGAEVVVLPGEGDPFPRIEGRFDLEGAALGTPRAALRLSGSLGPLCQRLDVVLVPLADGRAGSRVEVDLDGIDLAPLAAVAPAPRPALRDGRLQLAWDLVEQQPAAAGSGAARQEVIVHRCELTERGELEARVERIRFLAGEAGSGESFACERLEVDRPYLRLRRAPDGRVLGLGMALYEPEAPSRSTPGAEPRSWRIDDVRVDAGRLRFEDQAQPGAEPVIVEDLDLVGHDLVGAEGALPASLYGRWRAGRHAKAGGFAARLTLAGLPEGHVDLGVFGIDLRAANAYTEPLAEVRVVSGTAAVRAEARLAGGALDVVPRLLGHLVRVGGAGAARPLPGAGDRTLASVLGDLSDDQGAIDLRLPVRIDLQRVIAVERRLGEVRARLVAIAERQGALEGRLRRDDGAVSTAVVPNGHRQADPANGAASASADAHLEMARLVVERETLAAERERLRAERQQLLGLSPSAIAGEVVRQTVGGAVTALTNLFSTKRPPLRAIELTFPAGLALLGAADRERLRGVAQALADEPRTGLVIRGAAAAGRDIDIDGPADAAADDAAARRDLAERRALAVRDELRALGASPTQLLVGRPLAAEELGAGASGRAAGARLEPVR